eukprot:3988884-Amphidinium_carterae.1
MPYGRDVSPRGVSPGPLSAPSTGVTPRRVVASGDRLMFLPFVEIESCTRASNAQKCSGGASSREAVEPAGVYKEAFTRLGPAQEEEGDFASYAAPGRTRDPLSQADSQRQLCRHQLASFQCLEPWPFESIGQGLTHCGVNIAAPDVALHILSRFTCLAFEIYVFLISFQTWQSNKSWVSLKTGRYPILHA